MIAAITLAKLMSSGRVDKDDIETGMAGAKTGKDPYVIGHTSGGARIEILWDRATETFSFQVNGYAPDGSDLELEHRLRCMCGCGCKNWSGSGETSYCGTCNAGCCGEDDEDDREAYEKKLGR